jgi:hypothetical protein
MTSEETHAATELEALQTYFGKGILVAGIETVKTSSTPESAALSPPDQGASTSRGLKAVRSADWGMGMDEVRSSEPEAPAAEQDEYLAYNVTVADLPCLLVYIFASDQLVRVKYLVQTQHADLTAFIQDYSTLKQLLAKKYGESKSDRTIWKNELYKNDPPNWGMAVSVGHLFQFAEWKTSGGTVLITLAGDNFKVYLVIEYSSDSLRHLEAKATERRNLESL